MTIKPYSIDLRERVIKCLKEGKSYKEASKTFSISISAIGRWYKQEGHYQPRKRLGAVRKIDVNMLEECVKENPDMKLKDMSIKFKVRIHYWLKELGYSYKKSLYLCGSK